MEIAKYIVTDRATGQCCDAWRRWFSVNYDNAARQLRAVAQQRRANGESD